MRRGTKEGLRPLAVVDACCPAHFSRSLFFYSLEGSEPRHIHVEDGDRIAKFWLDPVQLAESRGFRAHELNRLRGLAIEHRFKF